MSVGKKKKKRKRYEKKDVTIDGRKFVVQGYEPFFLEGLDKFKLSVADLGDVPVITYFYKKKLRRYHPDFYIASTRTVVEIKSAWTMGKNVMKNRVKWAATVARGYYLWVIVYDGHGEILEHRKS